MQWAYNAQFASHAGAMTRDVRTVVATRVGRHRTAGARETRRRLLQARAQVEPVRTRTTTLFNENGSYIPSLALPVAFSLLHIFVTLAAVTASGREFRAATVPRLAGGRRRPAGRGAARQTR